MNESCWRTRRLSMLALAFAAAALSASAWGDTLYVQNGDRLTGTLVQVEGGIVAFDTEYAGELAVQQGQVRGIVTESSYAVRLGPGEIVTGRFLVREGEQLLILDGSSMPLSVPAILAVARDASSLDAAGDDATTDAKPAKKTWSATIDAGASFRSGTTDTVDAHTALTLVRKQEHNTLTIDLSGIYGEVDSQIDTRRAKGEAKWQYYPRERLYWFGLAGAEHDAGRALQLRINTAFGIGYDFIAQEKRELSADVGLDYTRDYWNRFDLAEERAAKRAAKSAALGGAESFLRALRDDPRLFSPDNLRRTGQLLRDLGAFDQDTDTRSEDEVNLRLSGRYEQALFAKSTLSEDLTLFASVTELGDTRITSDLALNTPLSNGLTLRINLLTEFDSDPGARQIEKLDNTLLTSVRYEF